MPQRVDTRFGLRMSRRPTGRESDLVAIHATSDRAEGSGAQRSVKLGFGPLTDLRPRILVPAVSCRPNFPTFAH